MLIYNSFRKIIVFQILKRNFKSSHCHLNTNSSISTSFETDFFYLSHCECKNLQMNIFPIIHFANSNPKSSIFLFSKLTNNILLAAFFLYSYSPTTCSKIWLQTLFQKFYTVPLRNFTVKKSGCMCWSKFLHFKTRESLKWVSYLKKKRQLLLWIYQNFITLNIVK